MALVGTCLRLKYTEVWKMGEQVAPHGGALCRKRDITHFVLDGLDRSMWFDPNTGEDMYLVMWIQKRYDIFRRKQNYSVGRCSGANIILITWHKTIYIHQNNRGGKEALLASFLQLCKYWEMYCPISSKLLSLNFSASKVTQRIGCHIHLKSHVQGQILWRRLCKLYSNFLSSCTKMSSSLDSITISLCFKNNILRTWLRVDVHLTWTLHVVNHPPNESGKNSGITSMHWIFYWEYTCQVWVLIEIKVIIDGAPSRMILSHTLGNQQPQVL